MLPHDIFSFARNIVYFKKRLFVPLSTGADVGGFCMMGEMAVLSPPSLYPNPAVIKPAFHTHLLKLSPH